MQIHAVCVPLGGVAQLYRRVCAASGRRVCAASGRHACAASGRHAYGIW